MLILQGASGTDGHPGNSGPPGSPVSYLILIFTALHLHSSIRTFGLA